MSIKRCENWLIPYIEGTLDERRRRILEERMSRDSALAAEAEALRRTTQHLRQAARDSAQQWESSAALRESRPIWPAVKSRLRERDHVSHTPWKWVSGAGLAAGLAAATLIFLRPQDVRPTPERAILQSSRMAAAQPAPAPAQSAKRQPVARAETKRTAPPVAAVPGDGATFVYNSPAPSAKTADYERPVQPPQIVIAPHAQSAEFVTSKRTYWSAGQDGLPSKPTRQPETPQAVPTAVNAPLPEAAANSAAGPNGKRDVASSAPTGVLISSQTPAAAGAANAPMAAATAPQTNGYAQPMAPSTPVMDSLKATPSLPPQQQVLAFRRSLQAAASPLKHPGKKTAKPLPHQAAGATVPAAAESSLGTSEHPAAVTNGSTATPK